MAGIAAPAWRAAQLHRAYQRQHQHNAHCGLTSAHSTGAVTLLTGVEGGADQVAFAAGRVGRGGGAREVGIAVCDSIKHPRLHNQHSLLLMEAHGKASSVSRRLPDASAGPRALNAPQKRTCAACRTCSTLEQFGGDRSAASLPSITTALLAAHRRHTRGEQGAWLGLAAARMWCGRQVRCMLSRLEQSPEAVPNAALPMKCGCIQYSPGMWLAGT